MGMAELHIETAGPCSTVQDGGRIGWQALGVLEGGVLDREALQTGNALLGNPAGQPAIEICQGGFVAGLAGSPVKICLAGSSEAVLEVLSKKGEARRIPPYTACDIQAGEQLTIRPFKDSLSVLLCLAADLDLPSLYGSQGTTANAGIGGLDGRLLAAGDRLGLRQLTSARAGFLAEPPQLAAPSQLRIIFGPQDDWFTGEARARLTDSSWQVTPQLSRMGMRLAGPKLAHCGPADIISDGIVRGHIQVPAEGQPIILMADHGTTGGYAKIATVISADLPGLGRLRPGAAITFATVTLEEAARLAARRAAEMAAILAKIQT
jgi:biotin-dependent carboxylase-like uncharacterized protein